MGCDVAILLRDALAKSGGQQTSAILQLLFGDHTFEKVMLVMLFEM